MPTMHYVSCFLLHFQLRLTVHFGQMHLFAKLETTAGALTWATMNYILPDSRKHCQSLTDSSSR